jgi:hypothetical protein
MRVRGSGPGARRVRVASTAARTIPGSPFIPDPLREAGGAPGPGGGGMTVR